MLGGIGGQSQLTLLEPAVVGRLDVVGRLFDVLLHARLQGRVLLLNGLFEPRTLHLGVRHHRKVLLREFRLSARVVPGLEGELHQSAVLEPRIYALKQQWFFILELLELHPRDIVRDVHYPPRG
jgi:hypothetical protein